MLSWPHHVGVLGSALEGRVQVTAWLSSSPLDAGCNYCETPSKRDSPSNTFCIQKVHRNDRFGTVAPRCGPSQCTFWVTQSLLLYLSSRFVPERSWLQHIGIDYSSWAIKYIYSLYWSVTTIVTVGYGDITPQNEYEVVVTIFIELSGSALFAYLINVIGVAMGELK